ncbi:hypothetical protein P4H32_30380 [Bacillus cereus]|nr:hypothetical protein [Bacillus cereus]
MAALIMFLLFFPLQYLINQQNHHDMNSGTEIVHRYAQKARTTGYFTPQILSDMRADLATKLRLTPGEITIFATTTPKYRLNTFDQREMIYYEVQLPIKRLIAINRFMGVSDIDNQMTYTIKGEVASEALMP